MPPISAIRRIEVEAGVGRINNAAIKVNLPDPVLGIDGPPNKGAVKQRVEATNEGDADKVGIQGTNREVNREADLMERMSLLLTNRRLNIHSKNSIDDSVCKEHLLDLCSSASRSATCVVGCVATFVVAAAFAVVVT